MKTGEHHQRIKDGGSPVNFDVRPGSAELKEKITDFIAASQTKVTPADLAKELARRLDIHRGEIRRLICALISDME